MIFHTNTLKFKVDIAYLSDTEFKMRYLPCDGPGYFIRELRSISNYESTYRQCIYRLFELFRIGLELFSGLILSSVIFRLSL